MEDVLAGAIVDDYVKTAAEGHHKLVLPLKRVPIAPHAAGNIVDPVVAHDVKGDVRAALDKGEIAPWIIDLGQFY